jgi:hypothetical protein
MAALIRAHDWSNSPLGRWIGGPNRFASCSRIMLGSRYAIWVGWGPELTFLYNDAYRRHDAREETPLGARPTRTVRLGEAWDDLGPRVDEVRRGQSTYDEHLRLLLERSGYAEETYHPFSYSPLSDDRGSIAGLLCIVVEDTARYLAERRLTVLRDMATRASSRRTEDDLFTAIATACAPIGTTSFQHHLLLEPDGQHVRLACSAGFASTHPAARPRSARREPLAHSTRVEKVGTGARDLARERRAAPVGRMGHPARSALALPSLSKDRVSRRA